MRCNPTPLLNANEQRLSTFVKRSVLTWSRLSTILCPSSLKDCTMFINTMRSRRSSCDSFRLRTVNGCGMQHNTPISPITSPAWAVTRICFKTVHHQYIKTLARFSLWFLRYLVGIEGTPIGRRGVYTVRINKWVWEQVEGSGNTWFLRQRRVVASDAFGFSSQELGLPPSFLDPPIHKGPLQLPFSYTDVATS